MSRDHYGRMPLPTSDLYIPEVYWPDSNRPAPSFGRDSQMTRPDVAEWAAKRSRRWVFHHKNGEFESPNLQQFDIRGYNQILDTVEKDKGKGSIVSVVLHLENVRRDGVPTIAESLSSRLKHYGFTRCERREDLEFPEICFTGPPTRWSC
jgi:hypothetical protein